MTIMQQAKDLHADYASAGFGSAIEPGHRPALILIDFARAYFDQASPLYAKVESVRSVAAELREAAEAAHVPIIFTRVEYVAGDPTRNGGIFYRKIAALRCFDRGNPLGDFTSELAPHAGNQVITKHFPSAFFGTGLAEQLHADGIDTLVITGLSTSGCVRSTAVDALCHGFVPLVVEDAVGDRDAAVHAANIFDMRAKSAEIMSAAQIKSYFASLPAS
jgi:maleamate amidohydrolase